MIKILSIVFQNIYVGLSLTSWGVRKLRKDFDKSFSNLQCYIIKDSLSDPSQPPTPLSHKSVDPVTWKVIGSSGKKTYLTTVLSRAIPLSRPICFFFPENLQFIGPQLNLSFLKTNHTTCDSISFSDIHGDKVTALLIIKSQILLTRLLFGPLSYYWNKFNEKIHLIYP